jgi:hypothetical protein
MIEIYTKFINLRKDRLEPFVAIVSVLTVVISSISIRAYRSSLQRQLCTIKLSCATLQRAYYVNGKHIRGFNTE